MKKYFDALTVSRRILIVGLFLIVLVTSGFGFSCQSLEPAPPATTPGSSQQPTPGTQPAEPTIIEVTIEGFAFKPAEINVPVGSTITWYNKDSVVHTATARDKTFDSGNLSGGDTFSYTFEEKGTYEYYCIPHPYMTGKVMVE